MSKVIVHSEGNPAPVVQDLDDKLTAAELIRGVGRDPGEFAAWLDESDKPLKPDAPVAEAGVSDGSQIAVAHKKGLIEVTVSYNNVPIEDEFKPQHKVRRVFDWAVGEDGFNLPREQRPEHELAVIGQDEAADLKAPISAYATDGQVAFELRRKDGFQG
jgi:hypothetical protein